MKLLGPKSLSTYLFYGTKAIALFCILLALYIALSFFLGNYEVNNGRFVIPFPLFSYFDIKGLYQTSSITSILLTLIYLGVFLYTISKVLESFKSKNLFSSKAIRNLNAFATLNLLIFPIFQIILRMLVLKIPILGGLHNLILSLILGIFILFVSEIFKRGLKVQEENNLTI